MFVQVRADYCQKDRAACPGGEKTKQQFYIRYRLKQAIRLGKVELKL